MDLGDRVECAGVKKDEVAPVAILYRVMFMEHVDECDLSVGVETFQVLVADVERCIRAGRFDQADPLELALQLWSSIHGTVALHLAGLLSVEQALSTCTSTSTNLFKAFGDDPRAVGRSWESTRRRARLSSGARR